MIRVKNLWKKYGSCEVLKGLDLEVKEKETLVILGRSGVGKSVLLKHLIGLEKPDLGTVEINNQDIGKLSKSELYNVVKDMGMLFQGSALFDSMDIEANVGFYLSQNVDPISKKRLKKSEIRHRVIEALKMVSLENVEKKMPADLSGGMKKRAGLARLIAYRPKILLYDEPTTGLDPITSSQINELIVKTQNELQGTTIVVTHDIHSALFIATKLALHEDGKIIHIDTPNLFMKIRHPVIEFFKSTLQNYPAIGGN